MAKTPDQPWQNSVVILTGTVVAVTIISALYWAQMVFVPTALAILLTFLLTPLVRMLERRGLGRGSAVGIVMVFALVVVGEVTWLLTSQMASLAKELPDYSANIQTKIHSIREASSGWDRVSKMVDDIAKVIEPSAITEDGNPPTVVVRPESGLLSRWPHFVGSVTEIGAGAALVFVLVLFGLLKREDLRNRFLRLIGHRRLVHTTKAVDEAGERVSRYLVTQACVNIAYGVVLAIGLAILGVKYAMLWGFFAALLRYVPYIGVWLSITFPIVVSIATAATWTQPLLVFGLFLLMEVITYNLVEPFLFKRSMGVSEVAQLLSAAFWGFLWGPIGLVLSAPLTVCLLVIGKYVSRFKFLEVLLGDDPPLEPPITLYQRLLAWDRDDAERVVADQLRDRPSERVYDELLVPVLTFTKRDRSREQITERDEDFLLQSMREIVDDIAPVIVDDGALENPVRVLGCTSGHEADAVALDMLQKSLSPGRWKVDVVPTDSLTSDIVAKAANEDIRVICIAAVPPGGNSHTRYLCKRLRARLPNAKIVVGRWGGKATDESWARLTDEGADDIVDSLEATRNLLNAWLPVLSRPNAVTPAESAPPALTLPRSHSANREEDLAAV